MSGISDTGYTYYGGPKDGEDVWLEMKGGLKPVCIDIYGYPNNQYVIDYTKQRYVWRKVPSQRTDETGG